MHNIMEGAAIGEKEWSWLGTAGSAPKEWSLSGLPGIPDGLAKGVGFIFHGKISIGTIGETVI